MACNEDRIYFIATAPPPPYDFVVERAIPNQPPQNPDYQSNILSENERLVDVASGGCYKDVCCKFFQR